MSITNVHLRILGGCGHMKAVDSVTFDNELVIHDIKEYYVLCENPTKDEWAYIVYSQVKA